MAGEATPAGPSGSARATRRTGREGSASAGLAWGDVEQPSTTRGDTLAIRWFTPRGRATRQDALDDLRFGEGAHLRELLADVRRPGLEELVLDLRAIDLRGEDLAGASLQGVDLSGAKLDGCDLSQADLRGAVLERATLTGAKLRGARLDGAKLRDADLSRADLTEASLEHADLDRARLVQATVHRARLAGAALSRADLSGVDLRTSFRVPLPFVDPRPTVVRRQPIGTPPPSEPRRPHVTPAVAFDRAAVIDRTAPTRRLPPPAPAPAPAAAATGRIIPHETVRMAREELERGKAPTDYDYAVAELLALRGRVDKVTIVVDGVERVLFAKASDRVAVRVG